MTPISHKLNVIIVDADKERQMAMTKPFKGIVNVYIYNYKKRCVEFEKQNSVWRRIRSPISFDIILIHGNECHVMDELPQNTNPLVIVYGGHEGHDPRIKEDMGYYQIFRSITHISKTLQAQEAEEIINFAQSDRKIPPSFFFGKNYIPVIGTIADFIHEFLYSPEEMDWEHTEKKYSNLFSRFPQHWNDFLSKVKNILQKKAIIELEDSDYQEALDELIEKTINT